MSARGARAADASDWARVLGALPRGPSRCLFRTTEGYNEAVVRAHGTDRHGRDAPPTWAVGHPHRDGRAFAALVFASTAAQVERWLATGDGSCALAKRPETPGCLLLVYRRQALVHLYGSEYAFRSPTPAGRRRALLAVFRLEPTFQVVVRP